MRNSAAPTAASAPRRPPQAKPNAVPRAHISPTQSEYARAGSSMCMRRSLKRLCRAQAAVTANAASGAAASHSVKRGPPGMASVNSTQNPAWASVKAPTPSMNQRPKKPAWLLASPSSTSPARHSTKQGRSPRKYASAVCPPSRYAVAAMTRNPQLTAAFTAV